MVLLYSSSNPLLSLIIRATLLITYHFLLPVCVVICFVTQHFKLALLHLKSFSLLSKLPSHNYFLSFSASFYQSTKTVLIIILLLITCYYSVIYLVTPHCNFSLLLFNQHSFKIVLHAILV